MSFRFTLPYILPPEACAGSAIDLGVICAHHRGARKAGWPLSRGLPRGGGKSGLQEATVPGNARAGQPDGERHRNETASGEVGQPKPPAGKGETVG